MNSWDLSTGVDGPGTRFVVFTAGCPLRCLYCQNPETWRMRDGHLTSAASLGNVERVDVLPFHKLGAGKYKALGIPFPLADTPTPTEALVREARERFAAEGLVVF